MLTTVVIPVIPNTLRPPLSQSLKAKVAGAMTTPGFVGGCMKAGGGSAPQPAPAAVCVRSDDQTYRGPGRGAHSWAQGSKRRAGDGPSAGAAEILLRNGLQQRL